MSKDQNTFCRYFAKFLPIEGTMEHTAGLNQTEIGEIIELKNRGFYKYLGEGKFQKMGLFLCSRDIEVGDKNIVSYTYKLGSKISYQTDLEFVKIYPSGAAHLKNEKSDITHSYPFLKEEFVDEIFRSDIFKVIGEISKDAVWVKEGDEFNDEDIEEWYWHLTQNCCVVSVKFSEEIFNKPPNFVENPYESKKELFKRGVFKIKCSNCNTFH